MRRPCWPDSFGEIGQRSVESVIGCFGPHETRQGFVGPCYPHCPCYLVRNPSGSRCNQSGGNGCGLRYSILLAVFKGEVESQAKNSDSKWTKGFVCEQLLDCKCHNLMH